MLVKFEDNEDRFGSFGELLGRSDRNDFMGPLKTQFFVEPFGEDDVAKHALGRGVEIVGFSVFCAVLKIRDRYVMSQREILSPEQAYEQREESIAKTAPPPHPFLVHSGRQACQEMSRAQVNPSLINQDYS